jgi:hypothetical protein
MSTLVLVYLIALVSFSLAYFLTEAAVAQHFEQKRESRDQLARGDVFGSERKLS